MDKKNCKVKGIKKNGPDNWHDTMQEFLWWKQAQGISEETLKDYKVHISRYFNRFPEAFGSATLKQSVLEYMSQQLKPASFNLRLIYLKGFFNWCQSQGYMDENPLIGIKKRKDEGRVVNLRPETMAELLALPDKGTYAGLRDYSLILLTIDSGIRPKEAFYLLPSDVNYRNLEITIRSETAKTRTSRTLPISAVTAQSLKELASARHSLWKNTTPIFCSSEGRPMNRNTWGDRLEYYSRFLNEKVRPYDLSYPNLNKIQTF